MAIRCDHKFSGEGAFDVCIHCDKMRCQTANEPTRIKETAPLYEADEVPVRKDVLGDNQIQELTEFTVDD